jgi:beta-galactosidase
VYVADPWKEGIEQLRVFSNCDEVVLRVNGAEIERRKSDETPEKQNLISPPFTFTVTYVPGDVVAQGLIDGEPAATHSARTPGEPSAIRLIADTDDRSFTADGSDIVMLYAEVVDEVGTVVTDADALVSLTVDGPGAIVGGPEIGSNPMSTIDGVAPAMVQAGTVAGVITVTAEAEGLRNGRVQVTSCPFIDDAIAAAAKPVYDFDRLRVDVGGDGQMVQFGWTRWDGWNADGETKRFVEFGGFEATLQPRHAGELRWLGQNNIAGPLGYVAEDGVWTDDRNGLCLSLGGLAVGLYQLRTYHHCPGSDTDAMDPLRGEMSDGTDTPVAEEVCLTIRDSQGSQLAEGQRVLQTRGRKIEGDGPGCATTVFESAKDGQVHVTMTANDEGGSIWLNGFALWGLAQRAARG